MMVFADGPHYNLALKMPEQDQFGKWRILVYDPMRSSEAWKYLAEAYRPGDIERGQGMRYGLQINEILINLLKSGSDYNLSLLGDDKIANDMLQAKEQRFQPAGNGWDCGPLCLWSAAIRNGMQKGWNEFKYVGRQQLFKDTGVPFSIREELLDD